MLQEHKGGGGGGGGGTQYSLGGSEKTFWRR